MDGNGRWASALGKSRHYGHTIGSSRVYDIFKICTELGCNTVTFFAMSSENMLRSEKETKFIAQLLTSSIEKHFSDLIQNKIKFKVIGNTSLLPQNIINVIHHAEDETKSFTNYNLNIAYNYGGLWDILNSVNTALSNNEPINHETVSKYLSTKQDYPDLIIRTGGHKRLSNFMLWQSAYSELKFLDTYWPDISKKDITDIFEEYASIDRKFGLIK